MKRRLYLSAPALLGLLLAGCGGGGSDSNSPELPAPHLYRVTFHTEQAAEGIICADANQNLRCDSNEFNVRINGNSAVLENANVALLNQLYLLTNSNGQVLHAAPAVVKDQSDVRFSALSSAISGQQLAGKAKEQAIVDVVAQLNQQLALSPALDAATALDSFQPQLSAFNLYFSQLLQQLSSEQADSVALFSAAAIQLDYVLQNLNGDTDIQQVAAQLQLFAQQWQRGYPLTATGVTQFSDGNSFELAAAPADFPGQDAAYTAKRSALAYRKLDQQGNVLPADAAEWRCVEDVNTGLIWEAKQNNTGSVQDFRQRFVYTDKERALFAAELEEASCSSESGVCTVAAYQQHLNQLEQNGLCGLKNWQLPTLPQLYSLVHFGVQTENEQQELLTIDPQYFPYTEADHYWTATASFEHAASFYETTAVWGLGFYAGYYGASYSYAYCTATDEECDSVFALPVRLVAVKQE